VDPGSGEPSQLIVEQCQFDLQLAFLRAGASCKNVEDEAGAIHDTGIDGFFDIASLAGGQFIVDDDDLNVLREDGKAQFFNLSLANIGCWIRSRPMLNGFRNNTGTGRNRKFAQFRHRCIVRAD